MQRKIILAIAVTVVLPVVLGSLTLAAQDRDILKVPDGVAFSDFKGYEDWQYVAVSQVKDGIKIIAANPAMTSAYRSGLPADGKTFPDGPRA